MGKPTEINLEHEHLTKTVNGMQGYYLTKQKILLIIIAVLILCIAVALVTGYAVDARKSTGSYCFLSTLGCAKGKVFKNELFVFCQNCKVHMETPEAAIGRVL